MPCVKRSEIIVRPLNRLLVEKDLAVIHSKIDDTEFAKLSAEGRTMTVEQAIALALEDINVSRSI